MSENNHNTGDDSDWLRHAIVGDKIRIAQLENEIKQLREKEAAGLVSGLIGAGAKGLGAMARGGGRAVAGGARAVSRATGAAAGDKLEQQLVTVAQQRDALRLTDEEREAIDAAAHAAAQLYPLTGVALAATLRSLLERTK